MNRRSLLLGVAMGTLAPVVTGAPALAGGLPLRSPSPGGPPEPRPFPLPFGGPPGSREVHARNLAASLNTLPAGTTQVIIVHGDGYHTTYAKLEAFSRASGTWQPVFGELSARIGSAGFSDDHVEGVPTTPTGVYAIGPTMYGIAANPGVRYPYHPLVSGDWWNENSASPGYNTFQHSGTNPGGASEALWQESPAYTHFAVITYNMPPNVASPVPNKGSGIFLHQFSSAGGNPTAGCVSLVHADLVRVLTWLDPAATPRIVLSPTGSLYRY